jgi:putative flavoprotein involved in K+ transport
VNGHDVVVIGAGQAGLGIGYLLQERALDFVILERSAIGESWRSGRWDSFSVNTPNWMNGLPGSPYDGPDPDGFLTRDELVSSFERHAQVHHLPIRLGMTVERVSASEDSDGFDIEASTTDGIHETLHARNVVVASGIQRWPKVPAIAQRFPETVSQLHASEYRRADALPDGAVLVVGSGQSGCQIAEDLVDAGRTVYLATGRVARIPRRYRGRDALDWMRLAGLWDQQPSDLDDPAMEFAAQPQISGVGRRGHTVSLQGLQRSGVRLMGRLVDVVEGVVVADDALASHIAFADEFSAEFKSSVDAAIEAFDLDAPDAEADPDDAPATPDVARDGVTRLHLGDTGTATVIWCTGFTGDFSWLDLPVIDDGGHPIHDSGVSAVPGITFLGFPWLHTRKSGIIYGIEEDARRITDAILANLGR